MWTNPIVVIKLVVKVSSEKRKSKQLFPTPAMHPNTRIFFETERKEDQKLVKTEKETIFSLLKRSLKREEMKKD